MAAHGRFTHLCPVRSCNNVRPRPPRPQRRPSAACTYRCEQLSTSTSTSRDRAPQIGSSVLHFILATQYVPHVKCSRKHLCEKRKKNNVTSRTSRKPRLFVTPTTGRGQVGRQKREWPTNGAEHLSPAHESSAISRPATYLPQHVLRKHERFFESVFFFMLRSWEGLGRRAYQNK